MNFSITETLAKSPFQPYFSEMQMSETEQKVLSNLQTAYPNNAVRFVRQTPIENLYEVILSTNVSFVYVDNELLKKTVLSSENDPLKNELFRYWFFGGVMFDMLKQTDLTKDLKQLAQMIDIGALPLQNAIVREKGKAQHSLYVFTDPLCPFCQQLEKTLDRLDNVRIYTFLTPLVSLHPRAREVASRIWCAADRSKALSDAMLNQASLPEVPGECSTPILDNEKLMRALAIKGTPTIFFADGHRATGALSKEKLLEGMRLAQKTQALAQQMAKSVKP